MTRQIAQLNYLRMAPRKVRAVGDLIRGLAVNEAEAQLLFERRRPAKSLLKLLRSAVADAKVNARLNPAKLYVQDIRVDQGPMLKRYLPRARGTASPIQKKMSHVTLVLGENEKLASPRFKMIVPKKVKLPPGTQPKTKKEKPAKEATTKAAPKPSGFFRKMFSRKSGIGN